MRHAFETALQRAERRAEEPAAAPPPGFPGLPAAPAAAAAAPAGHHSLWEYAAAWTPEADPPPPRVEPAAPPASPPPSVRLDDIASELGLAGLKTALDLARARRRFMWDNHPDRRRDLDRDLANRRVALANMLLDRAHASLVLRRGR
jgi:hypothetical protein